LNPAPCGGPPQRNPESSAVEAIVFDHRNAPISRAELALFEFAEKLTREPSSCCERDIDLLRQAGWSDRAILDTTLVISYFNFVNRVADGLGVELEEAMRGSP
jgi:uncharacterized peroxidase-related enzyme